MFEVDKNLCIACMQCIKDCPTRVISLVDGKAYINNDGCIKCGHCVAICPVEAVATDDYDMSEVIPYNEEDFYIDSNNLLNFIKFRRSIRRFKDKPVEKEKILKIIEAGRFTQTSTNSQDVSYTVVTEKLDVLKDLIYESLKKKSDYILENITSETEHLRRYANFWAFMYDEYKKDPVKNDKVFFNAPLVIFVTSPTPINGGLASSNMELMTDSLGLGTFFSGFTLVAADNNKGILDMLNIDDAKKIISCLVIGYPAAHYKRTVPRKKPNITWL